MSFIKNFNSKIGAHNVQSLGKDLGFEDLINAANDVTKRFEEPHFQKLSKSILNTDSLLNIGFNVGSKLIVGAINQGVNSVFNEENTRIPISSSNETNKLGKNDALYYTSEVRIGLSTDDRIRRMAYNNPNMACQERILASSTKDYLDHKKRVYLSFSTGFSQKGYAFLMEDTYLTAEKLFEFYKINQKHDIVSLLNNNPEAKYFAADYKTVNKFKFRSSQEFYNIALQIHLVKITDINSNLRDLIEKTTHNKLNKSLSNFNGKIKETKQYSDPILDDKKNQLKIDFNTSLDCRLNQCTNFRDRAHIVHTWKRILTPGSIWEFNLHHHLGKGTNLNKLYDLYKLNKEHPLGFVFLLEYVGDRRATIKRNKDGDTFGGYSPVDFNVEFEYSYRYTEKYSDDEDKALAIYYKKKKTEEDFEEDSDNEKLFCPDRQSEFHVDHSNIKFNRDTTDKKCDYSLIYDAYVLGTVMPVELNTIAKAFERAGLDPSKATPDHSKFNFTSTNSNLRGGNKEDNKYEGADTPPPPIEEEEQI